MTADRPVRRQAAAGGWTSAAEAGGPDGPAPAGRQVATPGRDGPPALAPAGQLDARVVLRRGSFTLDVAVTARPGEVVAVLGPNGAGKSTLLGVLAGLLAPDGGQVRLGGRLLTGDGVLVPPERRQVGLMGQDPLLFPHLSATENVAFGPRAQGRRRSPARRAARDWLARVGLAELADRRPGELSGGQRQRVALARALAAEPALLLLDEPLAALDVETAPEIRHLLRTHLRGQRMTAILVTHDVLDAAVVADRVLVLAAGRVVDDGEPASVLATPRSEFSAALAGLNLLTGPVHEPAAAGEVGALVDAAGRVVSGVAGEDLAVGDAAAAVFAPSAVSVFAAPVAGSPRNQWAATVATLTPSAFVIRLRTAGDPPIAVDVTPASVAELGLAGGRAMYLTVKATEVRLHRR